MPEHHHHPASYRDPSGFVFSINNKFYRQVQEVYAANYDWLLQSTLYDKLVKGHWLLSHTEIDSNLTGVSGWYKTLEPVQLQQISYPYEWGFEQLRDAALHTLNILTIAIGHGMILKDASPFNIQFQNGKPIFIDTLSFEKYDEALPWIAYRQFCECFLFPLYLGHYRGIDTSRLLTAYPDGIPVTVTERMLSPKGRFNMGVWMHVRLQNKIRRNTTTKAATGPHPTETVTQKSFTKQKLERLIQNLQEILQSLKFKNGPDSTWSNYYAGTILSRRYLAEKETIFKQFIADISFGSALDLGANDGYFSDIMAAGRQAAIIAIDADTTCMNTLYRTIREKGIRNILPLCIDIASPTPAIGFRNTERSSFSERSRAELVVALALLHHLVFGRNIPLADIAACLADLTTCWLVVEFVPLQDEKVQELIRNRQAFHLPYEEGFFEILMTRHFSIEKKQVIPETARTLYLMKKKS